MSKVVTVHGHTLELDMGPSCPNPGIRRQLDAKGEPYMCTSDLTTWIGIDGDWYRIYKPSITLEWPGILELAETEGSVAPVKYDDEWNTSDEETDDSTWIGEFDLRATYGVGFVESLPDIANGEMTEIRIKYTAEKCE